MGGKTIEENEFEIQFSFAQSDWEIGTRLNEWVLRTCVDVSIICSGQLIQLFDFELSTSSESKTSVLKSNTNEWMFFNKKKNLHGFF